VNGYGLDSCIAIAYAKGNVIVKRNLDRELDSGIEVYIPPFAYYEVKRGLVDAKATKQLQAFNELLEDCPLGQTKDAVFEAAVDIYVDLKSKGRLCDDMDVLIAAWCKTYDLPLVTNNTKHFENIDGLSLVDWSVAPYGERRGGDAEE
jgi:predicted nucleic acid-binding protein